MKKKTAQPLNINLLKRHDQSVFDSAFSWALSVGRLFIIITQFIALGAFLFRFVLDRQIIDLNDTIRDKQAVVKFMDQDEKTYRGLISRLATASKYQDEALEKEKLLADLVDIARGKMEFLSLISDGKGVSIKGTTRSVNILQGLINEYRSYPGVLSVSINSIETQAKNNSIVASFTLSFTPPLKEGEVADVPAQQ